MTKLKAFIGATFMIIASLYALSLLGGGHHFKAWLIGCASVGVTSWLFTDKKAKSNICK